MSSSKSLGQTIIDWLTSPINEHGTPYVGHPIDFSTAEQTEFLDLVHENRFVSRQEQVGKIRDILSKRKSI